MGWMQKLFETYEQCSGNTQLTDGSVMLPIAHTRQQAHIEIVIDDTGSYRRASVLPRGLQDTLIPCTENSVGRSGSRPVPHPLCDKLQYIAGDFLEFEGTVTSGFKQTPTKPFDDFREALAAWEASKFSHSKVVAIRKYIEKGRVIGDLVNTGILPIETKKDRTQLMKVWIGEKEDAPEIFAALLPGQPPESALVRWRVEVPGEKTTGTWEDESLKKAWEDYESSTRSGTGLCLVTGEERILAKHHPAKLRHGADKAKLISSNDESGFTFKGRFTASSEAAGVGYMVTQKAHSALRWLIGRGHAFRNGEQVVLSWAVSGKPLPDPWANTDELFGALETEGTGLPAPAVGDVGQAFATRLHKAVAGYRARIDDNEDIVVMGLDSATPGRMAITFYRELCGSDLIDRIQRWHEGVAWPQRFGKQHFVGAAAPNEIAEAAYGRRLDDKLRKATVERLLPCIMDGASIPRDLVHSCMNRSKNRAGLDEWEWEKCLGIACGLYRGFYKEREYEMALEKDRKTRDYLFGRLLAVADHLEGRALHVAGETRETTAARLMQRFADRPYSTWRTIELALTPYKARLRSNRAGFLMRMEKLLDSIMEAFPTDNEEESFANDKQLSGECLLAFHCQRQALWSNIETNDNDNDAGEPA